MNSEKLLYLPNFFIIGAAKAGTTTIYDILKKYKEVYLPVQKEPSFFCDNEYYGKGIDWYINTFFRNASKYPVRGEATPRYLYWGSRVIPRWLDIYHNNLPKIIVIFRNPADLVYSYYWQNVREGREDLSFSDALKNESQRMEDYHVFMDSRGRFTYAYSKIANYASQIKIFQEYFPSTNFLYLITEDLRDFPGLVCKLETFLQLEKKFWKNPVTSNQASLPRSRFIHQWLSNRSRLKDVIKCFLPYNLRYRMKRKAIEINLQNTHVPPLNSKIRRKLTEDYLSEIKSLEKLIDRDLSGWYKEK